MRLFLKFPSLAAALALLTGAAQGRFVEPFEIASEPAVKAAADKFRALKDKKEAAPLLKEMETAAAAGSAEASFMLGFLHHSGLTENEAGEKAKAAYKAAVEKGLPAAKNNLGLLKLALGEDPKAAIGMVEEAASGGYAPAQVSMGQMFLDGLPAAGIARDLDQARVWFERAVDAGDDDAGFTLALMYENGTGVTANQEKAVSLLRSAAEKGNSSAMLRLAAKLVGGQGIKADPEKGKTWFEKAIAAKVPGAKTALAGVYETGTGLTKDEKKAHALYTEAEADGDLDAINKLGYLSEKGIGTAKDDKKALAWYQKGAEKGIAVCIHNVGVFHDEGRGGLAKDEKAAFEQFYKASLKAFVPSQLLLALRYREGKGVMQDTQAALAWLERAMQNNDANAAVTYAAMMESGEAGFVNYEMSVKIYKELAGKGYGPAMVGLAGMLENGRGVAGDYRQAFMIYSMAAKSGYKPAEERLESLKKRLTPEQVKIAAAFLASGGKDTSPPASSPAVETTAPASAPETPAPAPAPDKKETKPSGTKPAGSKPATKPAPARPARAGNSR
jgi:uncharacterized protein